MQAHGRNQFIVEHVLVAAVVLAVAVISATVVITLAFTGDLPGLKDTSADAGVSEVAVSSAYDRTSIGPGEGWVEGWVGGGASGQASASSVGSGRADTIAGQRAISGSEALSPGDYRDLEINAVAGNTMDQGATSDSLENWEFMEQNPELFSKPAAVAPASGEGLTDYRFIEENVLLPGTEVGIAGPGEGLNDYRFIEENMHLPGTEYRVAGPGEGLNDYRFIEENTNLPARQPEAVDGLPSYQAIGQDAY